MTVMTNTKAIMMLIALATILIAGGLTITPVAYSTGNNYDDDHDDDDCDDDDSYSHHDDDDCEPEPDCDCKKPTVFSVIYNGPGVEGVDIGPDAEVTVEIYKKVSDIGDKNPLLTIEGIFDGESIIIDSNVYGKKKIESNTVYRFMQNDVEIAVISFHTSCSQPLFIGDIHSDGQVTVTVESGFDHKGRQSIFLVNDPICNEIKPTTLTVTKILSPENDLGTFILQIDGTDKTTEIGDGGTTGPVEVTPGSHTVSEIAGVGTDLGDYSTTIGGDCNADGSIVLVEEQNAQCTITNTLKIPTTITLKKALTQDNTNEVDEIDAADAFDLFITNVEDTGNPIEITMEKQEIEPGTYTLSETMLAGYEFVLIAGDSGCPSMLDMEEFTIEEGDHLTCVIYNDDDADAGEGGTGVAFGFNGLQFINTTPVSGMHSCATTGNTPPCVEKQGPLFVIIDELLVNPDTSIVLWSLTPPAGSPVTQVNNCGLSGVYPASFDSSVNGFGLFCSTFVPGTWNINYAFIET